MKPQALTQCDLQYIGKINFCDFGRILNPMLKVLDYKLLGKGMDPGKLLTGKLGGRKVPVVKETYF